jgi:hypothetical protein
MMFSAIHLKLVELQKYNTGAGRQWLTSIILATREAEVRRIEVQGQQFVRPFLKNTRHTQVVECLLCKCEALSSNPSPNNKKKTIKIGLEVWLK